MKQQHVSITIAARVGQSPIYPRVGQGLLGGTIVSVRQGDSEAAHRQLDELQHVFTTEFDRGELTVENLRPVLWAAHWLKAVRPVAQRASELLTLAGDRAFEPSSKAARDCNAVSRLMANVATTEPHCLTAVEAARKIRVPSDFYAEGVKAGCAAISNTLASALRADGIHPTSPASNDEAKESPAGAWHLDESKEGREGFYRSILERCMFGKPELAADEPHAPGVKLTEQEVQAAFGVGSPVVADYSPFRLYGFAHEMLNTLRLVHETSQAVGGVELYPRLRIALQQVVKVLHAIDGGDLKPSLQECQSSSDERLSLLEDTVVKTGHETLDRLERLERGLMALADYVGEIPMTRVKNAMEPDA